MFSEIKGGSVMLHSKGIYQVCTLATFGKGPEPELYAKLGGGRYTMLYTNGRTTNDKLWQGIVLPKTHMLADPTARGKVAVSTVAKEAKKRLGVK
jgi:hypothetical protein